MATIETLNNSTFVDDQGVINLPSGKIDLHTLRQVLNLLPFEIDIIDVDGNLVYYSDNDQRVNRRNDALLGTPYIELFGANEKDALEGMFKDFRDGAADHYEQWFPKNSQTIYNNYYAIRDVDGTYLGALQFTGDITRIQGFRGVRTAFNSGKSDK
jgi:DUF438 domain-containing protein